MPSGRVGRGEGNVAGGTGIHQAAAGHRDGQALDLMTPLNANVADSTQAIMFRMAGAGTRKRRVAATRWSNQKPRPGELLRLLR
jgi:hypothetical protein